MEILLVLLGICVLIIFICIGIDIAQKEKEENETKQKALEYAKALKNYLRKLELMRPNMLRRYEEKKAEGLAELDKWCKQYNMTIHQMEVFLGLAPEDYTGEIIEKLQDIENGIYAPRVGVAIGF